MLAGSVSEPWTYAKPSGQVKRSPAALDLAQVKLGGGVGDGDTAGGGLGEGELARGGAGLGDSAGGGLGDGVLGGGVGPACRLVSISAETEAAWHGAEQQLTNTVPPKMQMN
jgi:hypothetical protein